jgi:hypothetical protein
VASERAAAAAAARGGAAREQRLREELAELHAELDAFAELNQRIQEEAAAATACAVAERRRLVALEAQVVGLEAQVAVVRSERSTAESSMRGRLQVRLLSRGRILAVFFPPHQWTEIGPAWTGE